MSMARWFYRGTLPSPAIELSSSQGKQLCKEALENGTMECFFKLVANFQTQTPPYCALASLSVALNALDIDHGTKGPWRLLEESMLDHCKPPEEVKATSFSFKKLVSLAQSAGAEVLAYRTNESTIDDFCKYVLKCSTSDDCHIIASYHRAALKQTGFAHYSPIGGYHVGRDMTLILDVERHKYPPHWVPSQLLWEAMEATGQHRGFMLLSRSDKKPRAPFTSDEEIKVVDHNVTLEEERTTI